jgi:pimeloyl-ACP methyl ester carboxylesterase
MPSARANGLTLEYESFGDPANPPILLVMGLAAQMILWPEAFCELLADLGFRVVRFDNRDVGLSTSLDALGTPNVLKEYLKYALHLRLKAPYYIDDMARDTAALIDVLALGRAHVVGCSMGGMIAQNLAAMHPKKVATLTSIMSTTGSRKLPGPTSRARKALLMRPPKKGDHEAAVRAFMHTLRAIGSASRPAPEDYLRDLCERHVTRGNNPAGAARQLVAIAASGDRTKVVATIKVPTLVLHGREDPLVRPECGAETARVIHDAGGDVKLVMIEQMGHDLGLSHLGRLAEEIAAHCLAHPAW